MTNLFVSLYDEKVSIRAKELASALRINILNQYIDNIIVFYEGGVKIYDDKIRYVPRETKPTYKEFFDYANSISDSETISLIANSDISFDETLSLLQNLGDNDCWALSRWEMNSDGTCGGLVQNRGDSQDVWAFRGKIKEMPDSGFQLGIRGCDNKIAYEIKQAGYNISNPCRSVKTWHHHASNLRGYYSSQAEALPPPYYFPILPCFLPVIYSNNTKPLQQVSTERLRLLHVGLSATGEPHNGLQKAFIRNYDYQEIFTGSPNINETIISKVDSFNPHIVFIQLQSEGYIWESTMIDIKSKGCFVLNFTGDVRFPIPEWYYGIGKHIDLTLFSNMTDVEKMRSDGYRAEYLELGIDPEIYKPDGEIILSNAIIFMGNNYGDNCFPLSKMRRGMVEYMKDKFGNRFGLYGSGWPQVKPYMVSGNYNDSQPKEAAIYRAGKIAINISHFEYKKYSSDRMLRILGTGIMCLSKSFPDMPYTDGVHLRTWDTFKQLEDLCLYYLSHENERAQIAHNGCQFVHQNFTFENMALNIKKLYDRYK